MKKKNIVAIIIVSALGFLFFTFVAALANKSALFPMIYILLLFAMSVGAIIYVLGSQEKTKRIRGSLPPKTELAVVKEKTTEVIGSKYSTRTKFFVTFETQSGYIMCFEVEQEEYTLLIQNDSGILTYKESEDELFFEDFTAN